MRRPAIIQEIKDDPALLAVTLSCCVAVAGWVVIICKYLIA